MKSFYIFSNHLQSIQWICLSIHYKVSCIVVYKKISCSDICNCS